MIDHETFQVIKMWGEEIYAEVRKLVNKGVPLYEAVERAKLIVSTRRSATAPQHIPIPSKRDNLMELRIVCAAIRSVAGDVITSARHYDQNMHKLIRMMKDPEVFYHQCDQGFIDQFGKFYTREEAYILAKKNNQIIRDCDVEDELYSEHLY